MPKDNIDYSKTIIYKITCKDENINDIYVGHTTNFVKRKCLHKYACTNLDNKLKIYHIIRQNGGWENWDMTEIAMYNCKNKTEARLKEQQHYEDLNANLNSCPPFQGEFCCINCNFITTHKNDYNKHLLTLKHKSRCCGNEMEPNGNKIETNGNKKKPKFFICSNCNKCYDTNSGLWKHKNNCNKNNIHDNNVQIENNLNNMSDKDFIIMLVKQNSELLEVIKNMTHNSGN